jgi:NADH-quinone oxidoreductase subunit K
VSGSLGTYLALSAALLGAGVYGLLSRRNVVAVLIAIELILSAANLNFLAVGRFVLVDKALGQIFALFVIALAAAEVTVALSIALLLVRRQNSAYIDDARDLRG